MISNGKISYIFYIIEVDIIKVRRFLLIIAKFADVWEFVAGQAQNQPNDW